MTLGLDRLIGGHGSVHGVDDKFTSFSSARLNIRDFAERISFRKAVNCMLILRSTSDRRPRGQPRMKCRLVGTGRRGVDASEELWSKSAMSRTAPSSQILSRLHIRNDHHSNFLAGRNLSCVLTGYSIWRTGTI
jgi:hypothetical protein